MKVVSCVPRQSYSFADKLDWLDAALKTHKPDLFVTPQEYFGGVQQMFFKTGEPLSYKAEDVVNPIHELAKSYDCGIAFGAVIDDPLLKQRRERIFVVDPARGVTGTFDKMMLPAYDHIDAKSEIAISPETVFKKRARSAYVKGAEVTILFCWEVWSNFIWHALAKADADFVLSMIKFGIAGYPTKGKDDQGRACVTGFGYGDDGGWLRRLQSAAEFDVAAPIVCATNSWDQPKRSRPLCGTIFPYEEDTLAYPPKGSRGTIEELFVVDDIDPKKCRYSRENKFKLHEETGEWPSTAVRAKTMMWKVRRMERKFEALATNAPMGPVLSRRSRLSQLKGR